jgi:hypothetical protein
MVIKVIDESSGAKQAIFKESRYCKRETVHYYLFEVGKQHLMSTHLDRIIPDLVRLGAEGYRVVDTDHPDAYTTLVSLVLEAEGGPIDEL